MQSGWHGAFAIERDSFAFETLKYNLIAPSAKFRFDWPKWLPVKPNSVQSVQRLYEKKLLELASQIDAVVGGPPCQGFSSAGRRKSNDPRNRMVHIYLDFVRLIRPKFVLIENVRGITVDFSSGRADENKVNYVAQLTQSLSADYRVWTDIVDTTRLGVPQRRRRFFLVGVRRDVLGTVEPANPFDLLSSASRTVLSRKKLFSLPIASRCAISDLELARNGTVPSREDKGFEEIAYVRPLTSFQRAMNQGCDDVTDTRLARHTAPIARRFKKIIEICHADGRLNTTLSREMRESFGIKKCALRVLDPDNPSPTVTSMPDDLLHYAEPRTLTVRENARLQTFPDWYVFKGKYTTGGERRRKEVPRFTQVANAVPPLVAETFGEMLRSYRTQLQ